MLSTDVGLYLLNKYPCPSTSSVLGFLFLANYLMLSHCFLIAFSFFLFYLLPSIRSPHGSESMLIFLKYKPNEIIPPIKTLGLLPSGLKVKAKLLRE